MLQLGGAGRHRGPAVRAPPLRRPHRVVPARRLRRLRHQRLRRRPRPGRNTIQFCREFHVNVMMYRITHLQIQIVSYRGHLGRSHDGNCWNFHCNQVVTLFRQPYHNTAPFGGKSVKSLWQCHYKWTSLYHNKLLLSYRPQPINHSTQKFTGNCEMKSHNTIE